MEHSRSGGEQIRGGNYHQHDGSYPYQQHDGWGGGTGTGEQSRSATWGVGWILGGNYHQHEHDGSYPYHQHDGWGGDTGTGEQSRSYPTTNMMDPIPITNMMGGGGTSLWEQSRSAKGGGRGGELPPTLSPTWWVGGGTGTGEQSRSATWGGNFGGTTTNQHDGWGGTGTGEQSRSYPTTNMMDPIPITNMMGGGGREQGTEQVSNMGGGNRGGGGTTTNPITWGGNGNRGTEQVLSYHQHDDGSYPYHQHDGWGGGPVYGNRAGQQKGGNRGELPPTLSPTWWVGGGTGTGEQSRSATSGGGTGGELPATWWILSLSPTWWVGGNGDPIPITNMMGGEGTGTGEPRRSGGGNRGGNYHQHDGSYPYHQHDGWGGNGNRGTEQVLSYHQHDGSYPYHQHDGWGGEREQGNRAGQQHGGGGNNNIFGNLRANGKATDSPTGTKTETRHPARGQRDTPLEHIDENPKKMSPARARARAC